MSSAPPAPASATGDSTLERHPWDELRIVSHANRHLDARRQILALSCRAASVDLMTRGQTFSFARKQASPEVRALANQSPGLVRDLIREGFAHSAQRATSLERARLEREQAERLVAAFLAPPDKGVSTTKLVSERAALATIGNRLLAAARSNGYDLLTYDSGRLVVDLGLSDGTAKSRLKALRDQGLLRDVRAGQRGLPPRFKTIHPRGQRAELRSTYAFLADEILSDPAESMVAALWDAANHPAISHGPLTHRGWLLAVLRAAGIGSEALGIDSTKSRAPLRAWDRALGLPIECSPSTFLRRLDGLAAETGATTLRDEAEAKRREQAAQRRAEVNATRIAKAEAKRASAAVCATERASTKPAARRPEAPATGTTERRAARVPAGFDPTNEAHLGQLLAFVAGAAGGRWRFIAVDANAGKAIVERVA